MLTMAKFKKPSAQPVARDADEVKTRRRGGRLEFFDKHQNRWIERKVVPSLLDRLARDGSITDEEFSAGVRFNVSFEMAGLGPRYGSIGLDAIIVDGGKAWNEPIGGSTFARAEIDAACDYIGGFGADCLRWVIGMGETIDAFAMRCRAAGRRVEARSVGDVLCTALGTLARYYRRERRHGEGR